jgi:hypothetical protein
MDSGNENKGLRKTPTPKMLEFAHKTAARCGVSLPEEAETDFEACKRFLDEWVEKLPPSKKMIKYAQRIAAAEKIEIPKAILASQRKLGQWIDERAPRR